jgi:hypothetical protein
VKENIHEAGGDQVESRYSGALEDLKKDRQRLEAELQEVLAAIKALEKLAARSYVAPSAPAVASNRYRRMTIAQAAQDYLRVAGPSKVRDICDGLKQGGIPSGSKNIWNTVYGTLGRYKDIFRTENGLWMLVEKKEGGLLSQ